VDVRRSPPPLPPLSDVASTAASLTAATSISATTSVAPAKAGAKGAWRPRASSKADVRDGGAAAGARRGGFVLPPASRCASDAPEQARDSACLALTEATGTACGFDHPDLVCQS